VRIGQLRGPCSAKWSLEMEEETDWNQILCGLTPQVQYQKFWKNVDGKCFPTRHTVLT
jgi:hypothetical protein